jgi:hypothetical protein
MNIARDIIANDILAFCKEKGKKFITARYTHGHIICSVTEKPYTPHQLGVGFRVLKEREMAKQVSNNRWEMLNK